MFQIEKNIPVEEQHVRRRGLARDVINTCIQMKPGDSFLVPKAMFKTAKTAKSYIRKVIEEKLNNSKNYVISEAEGGVRVWLKN